MAALHPSAAAPRKAVFGLLLLALELVSGRRAAALPDVPTTLPRLRVELLTMSRGGDPFSRFGHAAFRVVQLPSADDVPPPGDDEGVVYNYGYTRFDGGFSLVTRFLRGEVRFWVALTSMRASLYFYGAEERAVYRHPLRLSDDEHRRLAAMLRENRRPENRYYTYHHYDDNCATRLRDMIDRLLGGALARQWRGKAALGGPAACDAARPGAAGDPGAPCGTGAAMNGRLNYRQLTREGFAGRLELLLLTELLLGRKVDLPLDRWQAAFLPRLLVALLHRYRRDEAGGVAIGGAGKGGAEAEAAGASGGLLLAPAVTVLARVGADPVQGDPRAGVHALWATAVVLTLLALAAAVGLRRRRRWAGLCLLPQALIVGLGGLLAVTLAALTTLPELRENELLLLLWPTDLLLVGVAVRLLRGRFYVGRLLRGYLLARFIAACLVLLGHLVGLLYQQPRVWLAIVGVPSALLWLAARRVPPPPRAVTRRDQEPQATLERLASRGPH